MKKLAALLALAVVAGCNLGPKQDDPSAAGPSDSSFPDGAFGVDSSTAYDSPSSEIGSTADTAPTDVAAGPADDCDGGDGGGDGGDASCHDAGDAHSDAADARDADAADGDDAPHEATSGD